MFESGAPLLPLMSDPLQLVSEFAELGQGYTAEDSDDRLVFPLRLVRMKLRATKQFGKSFLGEYRVLLRRIMQFRDEQFTFT